MNKTFDKIIPVPKFKLGDKVRLDPSKYLGGDAEFRTLRGIIEAILPPIPSSPYPQEKKFAYGVRWEGSAYLLHHEDELRRD